MSIKPIFPIAILLVIFVILFAATGITVLKSAADIKNKVFSLIRLFAIYALALIIGLRPVIVEEDYEFQTRNLNVLFIVDTTISMWADDYKGSGSTRMEGAVKDANFIMNGLLGANFGIVTFDNTVHVISPFTQDAQFIRDMFNSLMSPDGSMAKGSKPSIAYKDVESLLKASAKKENRKTIVFFMGDGEITNSKPLEDYSALSEYIDDGAVFGYGSAEGGKMRVNGRYITDPATRDTALSYIDEDNLKKIAEDLGITYINLNKGNAGLSGIVDVIMNNSKTITEEGLGVESYKDIYYYFAYPLILLLFIEIVVFVRKGRL